MPIGNSFEQVAKNHLRAAAHPSSINPAHSSPEAALTEEEKEGSRGRGRSDSLNLTLFVPPVGNLLLHRDAFESMNIPIGGAEIKS